MKNKFLLIIIALVSIASFSLGYCSRKSINDTTNVIERIDTIMIYKTVSSTPEHPVSITPSTRYIFIPYEDIAFQEDSTVSIASETAEYRDTLADGTSYIARISGIQPKLEYLSYTFPSPTITKTITERKPYEGWLLSLISTGIVSQSPNWLCQSTAALELSYNTGPFHIGLQGGILIGKELSREAAIGVAPYLGGRITIDIFRLGR